MAKAYYGPGSTGGATGYSPAPIVHGISNPPFFHTNGQLPTETGAQWADRIEREWQQRGMRDLPASWDVLAPGGPGVAGTGAFATPSPFLFPGSLPSQGIRMPDGSVIQGSVNSQGQILGTQTGGSGTGTAGSPTLLGTVNSGLPGAGGAGGSLNLGVPSSPSMTDADALLQQARERAFGRLDDVDQLYQTRLADLTNQALERQIQGTDQPFGEDRFNQMEARLAAQAASADRGRRSQIRDSFAARGLGGSAMQKDAELQSMSAASAQRGANLTNLLIQQAQENFQARERAQAGAQSWLAQQAAGIMPAILKEADMLSRFEVTGDGGADQDIANALTSQALGQLAGPNPATNPAAFNTQLPFGPGATGNISTPGGPPIRATGGVQGGFTPGTYITQAGQGGGLNGSQVISSLYGNGATQASNATQGQNYNPFSGTTPSPAPLALPQQQQGPVPYAAPQQAPISPFTSLNSFTPYGIGGYTL